MLLYQGFWLLFVNPWTTFAQMSTSLSVTFSLVFISEIMSERLFLNTVHKRAITAPSSTLHHPSNVFLVLFSPWHLVLHFKVIYWFVVSLLQIQCRVEILFLFFLLLFNQKINNSWYTVGIQCIFVGMNGFPLEIIKF